MKAVATVMDPRDLQHAQDASELLKIATDLGWNRDRMLSALINSLAMAYAVCNIPMVRADIRRCVVEMLTDMKKGMTDEEKKLDEEKKRIA